MTGLKVEFHQTAVISGSLVTVDSLCGCRSPTKVSLRSSGALEVRGQVSLGKSLFVAPVARLRVAVFGMIYATLAHAK